MVMLLHAGSLIIHTNLHFTKGVAKGFGFTKLSKNHINKLDIERNDKRCLFKSADITTIIYHKQDNGCTYINVSYTKGTYYSGCSTSCALVHITQDFATKLLNAFYCLTLLADFIVGLNNFSCATNLLGVFCKLLMHDNYAMFSFWLSSGQHDPEAPHGGQNVLGRQRQKTTC
jgi:hypothetical protein